MEEETDFIEIHFPSRYISWILKDWIPYAIPYASQNSNSEYSEIHLKDVSMQSNCSKNQENVFFIACVELNGRMLKETNQQRPII